MSWLSLVILGFPFVMTGLVIWDSRRRFGRAKWGWASFAFVACIASVAEVGRGVQGMGAGTNAVAFVLGSVVGVGSAVFALYRIVNRSRPATATRETADSPSQSPCVPSTVVEAKPGPITLTRSPEGFYSATAERIAKTAGGAAVLGFISSFAWSDSAHPVPGFLMMAGFLGAGVAVLGDWVYKRRLMAAQAGRRRGDNSLAH